MSFSLMRLTQTGYVLGLSVVISLLLSSSTSKGQFRGNFMPPMPMMLPLNNGLTDDVGASMIMSGMGGMGGMMGMGGGMMGMMGMGGGMMGGMMMGMGGFGGMSGMMMGMGGMNMMGGMMGFAGKGFGGFNGRKAL